MKKSPLTNSPLGFSWYRSIKQFNQTRFIRITHRALPIWLNPVGMLEPQIITNLLQQASRNCRLCGPWLLRSSQCRGYRVSQ